ncbi:MAG: MbnP family copper-binding protein, partial [Myxococcota bacterium]
MKRILALVVASAAFACGSDDPITVDLDFNAEIAGQALACDTEYSTAGAMLADARLFISEIELMNSDGEWVDLDLDQETIWQHQNIALLDFENGVGSCSSSGTTEMNGRVTGTLPEGDYDGLRFSVGVPFDQNHLDDATAPAPLNSPGMFWAWQDGYKFLRVDWMPTGGDRWNVHLGSRACDNGGNPNTAPPSSCGRSNRSQIEIESFSLGQDIAIDFFELVENADITT